jgi:hypothetical protein
MSQKEKELYEPIRRELADKFSVTGKTHLEVSADGRISETVKEKLDDVALHIINFERVRPDIIGFVKVEMKTGRSTGYFQDEKIVAEIKNEQVGVADVIQTKVYAEVFDAKHAFLISSEPIPEEIKRFVRMKLGLLSYAGGYGEIRLVQFDRENETFVEKSWYRESPFEGEIEEAEEERESKKAAQRRTWREVMAWVTPQARSLFESLTKNVESEFPSIDHAPLWRYYGYYIDNEKVRPKLFLAIIAGKKHLTCRIRVNPSQFQSGGYTTRDLTGWFFRGLSGTEKALTLESPNEISKIVPLIRQSYDFVKSEA